MPIVRDPEILSGMPVVAGTRVLAYDVAASMQKGIPVARILEAYPRITWADILDCVRYAEENPPQKEV